MSDIRIISDSDQGANEKSLERHLKEENLREQAKRARDLFQGLHDELNNQEDIKEGLSFLDMKNDTLLSYMIDVCNIVLRKVRGESIVDHPSVHRSVEYRVILEKIKAIDLRLAYQLNKLIALPEDATEEDQKIDVNNLDINIQSGDDDNSESDESERNDPSDHGILSTKKGVFDRDEEDEDDDEDDEDEDEDKDEKEEEEDEDDDINDDEDLSSDGSETSTPLPTKPVGVYKPPKLRSVAYDDGRQSAARRKDHSDFYRDDNGDELVDEARPREDLDKKKFEEENYTRIRDNPKKNKRKQSAAKAAKKFKGGRKKRR